MVELLAIRHAPVDAEGVCYGRLDLPTRLSAAVVADRLREAVEAHAPIVVWSSDAGRCAEPAALLARRLDRPHRVDERLRELDYGAWEGLLWSAIPPAETSAWMSDWIERAPPGGESAVDLGRRVASWWADLAAGAHLLVAHAGVMHALDVVAGGRSWTDTMERRYAFLEAVRYRGAATEGGPKRSDDAPG